MKTKRDIDPVTRKSVEMFLRLIADDYPVRGALLYGSRARGDAGPDSDADVAVLLDGPKGRSTHVGAEMGGIAFDVMLETGVDVSPLPIWMEDWQNPDGHNNPFLIASIKREGVAFPECKARLDARWGFQ